MWARMRRVPLTAVIRPEKQDPTVKTRLREPEHAAAVLAWAVAGCLAYQREGFGRCTAVERSTAAYRAEMDLLGTFFGECCAFEVGTSVARADLRRAYEEWAKENGIRNPASARDFTEKLRDRGAEDGKSNGVRVWKHVRLLGFDEDPAQGHQGHIGTPDPYKSPSRETVQESVRGVVSLGDPGVPPRPRQISLDPETGELVEVEL
jgi:phage/plasmid-associated DNA primase